MLIRLYREKGLCLSVYVDDFKLAGKKQNIDPMWKILVIEVDLGEPTSFFNHVLLRLHSTRVSNKQITEICLNPKSLLGDRKATPLWATWRKHFLVVLWYGRSCHEMCGAILRAGEQNDSTVIQSRNTIHWRPPKQGGRNGICWRIVKSLLTHFSEMPVHGPHWWTWYFKVCEQTCSCRHWMDQHNNAD